MTESIVHTEGVETEAGALAAVSRESGVMALAMMNDVDFEARIVAMKLGQERVRRIQRELMIGPTPENPEGEDYGVIPGTKKPTLLKPGAEKLCQVYGLVPSFTKEWHYGDGVTSPHLRLEMTCYLHRGSKDGPIVGEGVGAANSWEKKHRYRGGQRTCPACGCEGTIRRSRFERDGDKGWYCHDKAGGCGENFRSDDQAIAEQQVGTVENPDPYEAHNTLLKMATKRAQVDAVLRATATSGLFTQDVEDNVGGGSDDTGGTEGGGTTAPPPAQSPPPAQTQPPRQAAPAQQQQQQRQAAGQKAPDGKLPRWTAACPRCGKKGCVIVSNMKPGYYHCWKKSSATPGCGYDFRPEDAANHASAANERARGGMFDDRDPGQEG